MSKPSFFICGVTGNQGGATTRQLLHDGNNNNNAAAATVHALTRNPSSPKTKSLQPLVDAGTLKLWPGDYDNEPVLREALSGTSAVFLNFMPDFQDPGANLRQAKLILQIAKETGTVRHVVYSSSVGLQEILASPDLCEPGTLGHEFLTEKAAIEQLVRECGLGTWTILRPSNFMANYVNPLASIQVAGLADEAGTWKTANQPSDLIHLVDTLTIGRFGGAALLDPKRFAGKVITYADEARTMGDIVRKLGEVSNRDLRMISMTEEEIASQKKSNPFIGGQLVMKYLHKFVDMDEVRNWDIPLSSFDEYLEREKDAVHATYVSRTAESYQGLEQFTSAGKAGS